MDYIKNHLKTIIVALIVLAIISLVVFFFPLDKDEANTYVSMGTLIKMGSNYRESGSTEFYLNFYSDVDGKEKMGILDKAIRFYALRTDSEGIIYKESFNLNQLKSGDRIKIVSDSSVINKNQVLIKELYVNK